MKTINKTFDAVKFMRQQRDKLSAVLGEMSGDEILAFFKEKEKERNSKTSKGRS